MQALDFPWIYSVDHANGLNRQFHQKYDGSISNRHRSWHDPSQSWHVPLQLYLQQNHIFLNIFSEIVGEGNRQD